MNLSIVMPAYNEEQNIKRGILDEVYSYLYKQTYGWEVIIVDDGSTDQTSQLVGNFIKTHKGFSLLWTAHKGKASAIINGFQKGQGDIFLFTDFDQSVPIGEIEKILPILVARERKFFPSVNPRVLSRAPSRHARASEPLLNALRVARALPSAPPAGSVANRYYDIVIGSRVSRKGAPVVRRITGYGFVLLQQLLLGLPYKDTQCGFKAFTREAACKIIKDMTVFSGDTKEKGYAPNAGFDLELLITAVKLGLKVGEVPVSWRHRDTNKFNTLKVSFLALKDIISIRKVFNKTVNPVTSSTCQ